MKNYIDPTLTPENAKQKGYQYLEDIIYDTKETNETLKDILLLIEKQIYKLGSPSQPNDIDSCFGLYMPTEEKEGSNL